MTKYGWKITCDFEECRAAGTMGPRSMSDDIRGQLNAGAGRIQRLYDDDGNPYFEARLIGGDGFEVLDNYGEAFGCTEVRELIDGVWNTL